MGRKAILCPHGVIPKSNCRECKRDYSSKYYLKNREKILENVREYQKKNREKCLERDREYDKIRRYRDIKKVRARNRLRKYPKLYPLAPKCEFCSSTENLEHGHIDYDYPQIYVTVCSSCNKWMNKPIND